MQTRSVIVHVFLAINRTVIDRRGGTRTVTLVIVAMALRFMDDVRRGEIAPVGAVAERLELGERGTRPVRAGSSGSRHDGRLDGPIDAISGCARRAARTHRATHTRA